MKNSKLDQAILRVGAFVRLAQQLLKAPKTVEVIPIFFRVMNTQSPKTAIGA